MRRNPFCVLCGVVLMSSFAGLVIWLMSHSAVAQTSGAKSKLKQATAKAKAAEAKEAKELETRAEDNVKHFLESTFKLAEDFEKAGAFELAQDQLRLVRQIRPDFPGIKEKIDKLSEAMFDANDLNVEHDVKEGWKAHALVAKGKPIRIEGFKDFNLQLAGRCDASGISTKDIWTEMAAGIRCGALMGMIVPIPEPGKPANKNDKISDPFEIGTSKDFTPKDDGVLLLNVNLPQGHKSVGKLSVKLSGYVKPLPKESR